MKTLASRDLKPGMVIAERLYTPAGQFLIEKNSVLTAQMISHIKFYKVPYATVKEDPFHTTGPNDFVEKMQPVYMTHAQQVKSSREYQVFEKTFRQKTDLLRSSLNDFIMRGTAMDTGVLLSATRDLFSSQKTTISMLDMLHNMRQIDDSTYAHSVNVALIARMMGMWVGYPESELDVLTLCGLLHDVGKAGIPDRIIGKPARLTPSEFEIIKKHPKLGYDILQSIPLDLRIRNAALMHHERYDGTGYPSGLAGNEIDDFAAIISIADVYDAMTANRCYRAGLCPFEAIALFEQEGLQKYHPKFILIFLQRIASSYVHNDVLLNDGETGEIVLINRHLTRPLIQTGPQKFLNLEKRLDLYIQAVI